MQSGTFAEIDVTRAEAELARRQRDLVVARSLVRQQETTVIDYVTRGPVGRQPTATQIVATDPLPEPSGPEAQSLNQLYSEALRNRPEAAQVELQLENAEFSLDGSKNEVRPELDVVVAAENSGLAGVIQQQGLSAGADVFLMGGLSAALAQLAHNNFPTYSIGVQLALPLRNRAARSDVLRDELTVLQQQIRVRQLEKQIRLEVTNA